MLCSVSFFRLLQNFFTYYRLWNFLQRSLILFSLSLKSMYWQEIPLFPVSLPPITYDFPVDPCSTGQSLWKPFSGSAPLSDRERHRGQGTWTVGEGLQDGTLESVFSVHCFPCASFSPTSVLSENLGVEHWASHSGGCCPQAVSVSSYMCVCVCGGVYREKMGTRRSQILPSSNRDNWDNWGSAWRLVIQWCPASPGPGALGHIPE